MSLPLWLGLAVLAYAMFAVTGVVDKLIVTNKIKNPVVVSFWVAVYGIPSAVILVVGLVPAPWAEPFRFQMPSLSGLVLIAVAGVCLQLALLASYSALKLSEATRVASAVGAATPVFALVFAYLVLGEKLAPLSYLAFGLLLGGAVMMLRRRGQGLRVAFWLAIASAGLAAFESVLAKLIYEHNHFISSFALLGMGNVVYCLALVALVPAVRKELAKLFDRTQKVHVVKRVARTGSLWVLFNTIFGGVGVIVFNLALKLGPASLVNALKGLQYVGIFAIALLLSRAYPRLLREEMTAQTMRQKVLGIVVIAAGLALVTVAAR